MSTTHEDSQMLLSSTDDSDSETTTPINQTANTSQVLSPPDSQHRETRSSSNMPTSASGSSIANSNGKRPLQTISNGADDIEELQAMANGKARAELVVKTHHPSGYQYSRIEDEPGYAWQNKKAQDEYQRAWEQLSHKDAVIKNRYGDPFELVEKEQAMAASLKQR